MPVEIIFLGILFLLGLFFVVFAGSMRIGPDVDIGGFTLDLSIRIGKRLSLIIGILLMVLAVVLYFMDGGSEFGELFRRISGE